MSNLSLMVEQFHWLRPLWLLALIPAGLLTLWLWRQNQKARQWSQLIAPELLPHLVDPNSQQKRRSYLWGLLAAWTIASISLAGPSWEQKPLPVYQNEDALVIVLDLSPSMLAEDIKPSRLVRAQMKITDVLRDRKEGFTGLVSYAGDAHVVSPLTDDTATIQNLLRVLHPNIMPTPGSNVEAAIVEAQSLLADAGMPEGQILLLTDGVVPQAVEPILNQLQDTDYRLSILGVGTPDGAPIPNERGGFERDRSSNIIIAQLEEDRLERLAGRTGGRYERVDRSEDDVQWLLDQPSLSDERHRQIERNFDTWYDRGPWLALLLLPLVLYSFRRGLLTIMFCLPLLSLYPESATAADWRAPWLTPNQRAERALEEDDPEAAAELFETPEWRGTALYRAGEYEAAAEAFEQGTQPRDHYNRGNALARAGDLEAAIDAYDQALEQAPDMEDAAANRALVEQLLEQQQEQEQQDQDQQDQDQEEQDQDEQESDDENSDEGESEPQDSDQEQDNSEDSEQDSDSETDENESDSESQNPDEQNPDEQNPDEENQDEQDAEQQEQDQIDDEAEEEAPVPTLDDSDLSDEERQAMEQWLRRVPDDPGGLLRRKFEYESQQRRIDRFRGEESVPDTQERW